MSTFPTNKYETQSFNYSCIFPSHTHILAMCSDCTTLNCVSQNFPQFCYHYDLSTLSFSKEAIIHVTSVRFILATCKYNFSLDKLFYFQVFTKRVKLGQVVRISVQVKFTWVGGYSADLCGSLFFLYSFGSWSTPCTWLATSSLWWPFVSHWPYSSPSGELFLKLMSSSWRTSYESDLTFCKGILSNFAYKKNIQELTADFKCDGKLKTYI
jgi:hypothetical protein